MSQAIAESRSIQPSPQSERVGWAEFLARFDWRQGEHVTLIGPTGQGKTSIVRAILEQRDYTVSFAAKAQDDVMMEWAQTSGIKIIRHWRDRPVLVKRLILWPDIRRMENLPRQKASFATALMDIYSEGGWAVDLDELWYICKRLNLAPLVETLWHQGRSLRISVIGCTTQPTWVPLAAYSQATHLFLFHESDRRKMLRLGEISGIDHKAIAAEVAVLTKHEFLYVNTRTGESLRSILEV